MSRFIAAELFKLRTTRTFLGVCLGILIPVALICGLVSALDTYDPGDEPGEDLLNVATFVWMFALIIGVLGTTGEFRHGTITPTLLAAPDRPRLVAAKVVAHIIAGMILGALAFLVAGGLSTVILESRSVESGLQMSEFLEIFAGGTLAAGLYAAVGIGLGALIGNQVVGIIVPVIYLFVLEALLAEIPGMDWLGDYGLNGTAAGMAQLTDATFSDDLLDPVPAGLVLLGITAVFVAAGTLRLARRDVESKT